MAQHDPPSETESDRQESEDAHAPAAGGAEPPAAGAAREADGVGRVDRAEEAHAKPAETAVDRDEAAGSAEPAEQQARHADAAPERSQRERADVGFGRAAGVRCEEAEHVAPAVGVTVEELFLDERDILTRPVSQRGVVGRLVSEEAVRAGIALLLFLLLAAVILAAFLKAKNWEQTKQLLDAVLPTVTALLGSAIGFYFGTRIIR